MTLNNPEKTVVDARASVLSFLFYKGRFEVPWHQRYYDWTKEHITELLYDLDEAFRENRECYFLGAVMLVERSNGIWEINDGQQRMVTFSLICARLARIFSSKMDTRREGLALRILFNLNENHTCSLSDADEFTPRLSPPRNDKIHYNLLIRGKDIAANGNLTTAWDEIDKYFLSMDFDKAKNFFDFIINDLEIACLFVPEQLDPSSVFETLNARGKPLGDLDLIRNYFYSFFSRRQEEPRRNTVHSNLESVRTKLREERNKTKALEYMRCYLQCKYGFLPKDRLYRETKSKIKINCGNLQSSTPSDYVFDLVEDISCNDKIEIFHAISSPSENDNLITYFLRDATKGNSSSRNIFVFLSELKNYKVTQPLVFALLNYYVQETDGRKKKKIANFVHTRLKLLTSFVMRTAFVAPKFEPSHFESAFSNLAQKIMFTDLDAIPFADVLHENDEYNVFDDSSFIEQMKQTTVRDKTKAKRFFLGLTYYQQPSDIIINERKYTVEHILPKSDEHLPGWPSFDQRGHVENVFRIGNLTLLSNAHNNSSSTYNGSFSKKVEIYQDSIISLTRKISRFSDWSPAKIQKRQEDLAKLAARVWSLPDV